MNKQTILFLGSKPIGYHCLDYLIQQKDTLSIEIVGVLTNDNTRFDDALSIKKLAAQYTIPVFPTLVEMPEVDYIISVQYHKILKQADINKATKLAINLHMAPLPDYRGCNQFSFAILDNAKEFGTTIHQMDAGIDHGDILFEKRFPIPENCWVEDLYKLTHDHSLSLFKDNIADLFTNHFTKTTQASLIPKRGTTIHYRKEMNQIKEIDLNWDAQKIAQHIRATYMPAFEPPFTIVDDQKIYFSKEWQKK